MENFAVCVCVGQALGQTFFRPFHYLSHGEPVRGKRYWEAKHPTVHPTGLCEAPHNTPHRAVSEASHNTPYEGGQGAGEVGGPFSALAKCVWWGGRVIGPREIFLNWFEKLLLLSACLLDAENDDHQVQSPGESGRHGANCQSCVGAG